MSKTRGSTRLAKAKGTLCTNTTTEDIKTLPAKKATTNMEVVLSPQKPELKQDNVVLKDDSQKGSPRATIP